MHLTPVSSIVQLRPGFQYLDTPEPAAEATDDAAAGELSFMRACCRVVINCMRVPGLCVSMPRSPAGLGRIATGEDDEEEAVTVKVQTTRERKMAARRAAQAEPDETWVNLKVFSRNVWMVSLVCSDCAPVDMSSVVSC